MKDFSVMKSLIGETLKEEELKYVECYVHDKLGLFIPSMGQCGYAGRAQHTHPSYMITILFSAGHPVGEAGLAQKPSHYASYIWSPDVPHNDWTEEMDYYCILIEKEYFEAQYRMYHKEIPYFENKGFLMCSDILKALNTFAFEYTKSMMNSDITLGAQVTVITHWIVRSILGESLDMRSVSSNYTVGRAQQYMEHHFAENITVAKLAELGHMSESGFNRIFKKELNVTPIRYLQEVRMEKSKILLRRKELSVTEIAAGCGFGSSAHFAAEFKRLTHVTPSEYREAYLD